MEEIIQWLTLNLDKLAIYLGSTTVGGITLWKLGSIFVNLVKNRGKKKYLLKIEEIENRVNKKLEDLKEYQRQIAKEEAEIVADIVINSLNRLQDKTIATKKEIYNRIFNKEMQVKEIVEVVEEKPEIEPISNESEIVEEIINETPIIENKGEIESQAPKKKVDLL